MDGKIVKNKNITFKKTLTRYCEQAEEYLVEEVDHIKEMKKLIRDAERFIDELEQDKKFH